MKFVKEHLTLVICGVVLVLALVYAFAPIPMVSISALEDDLRGLMQTRYAEKDTIQKIGSTPLDLPGLAPGTKGPPSEPLIEVKKAFIDSMGKQKKEVDDEAQRYNASNRFDPSLKLPILPVPQSTSVTKLGGLPMRGYLPTATADRMAFRATYDKELNLWRGLLSTGTLVEADMDATVPPHADKVKSDFDEMKKAAAAAAPPGGLAAGMGGQVDSKELWDYERGIVLNRAAGLIMYVEPTAFQMRAWMAGANPPTDEEIFDTFVESWFESDIVKAIMTVNNSSLANAKEKNVGSSAIKRLTRIVIGNNAKVRQITSSSGGVAGGGGGGAAGTPGDPGPLFFSAANASATGGSGAPVTGTPTGNGGGGAAADIKEPPNQIDYNLGMTGRAAGGEYDVVQISIMMDLDPAYLSKFIDQLYRQNMGYTVTNVQFRTVDPLDRASNGYLYGEVQAMEVEIQLEGILFRSWTRPLMPKDVKAAMSVTQ